MTVESILKDHKGNLITCRPEDTIDTIAVILTSKKIGALPVRDGERKLVGIISERDIVRGLSEKGAPAIDLKVKDLMSSDVATCKPANSIRSSPSPRSVSSISRLATTAIRTLLKSWNAATSGTFLWLRTANYWTYCPSATL